ncbi:unnamed protein product [Allacma fusca]|uniref:PiggyBac transposable element-derived protein domain-containing protein n=1 Tax=Allacma fusca TaxID=39272 RepID=A0A8J2LFZ1_9HEXA|nr:unnamed protein product [Allacma fusca]
MNLIGLDEDSSEDEPHQEDTFQEDLIDKMPSSSEEEEATDEDDEPESILDPDQDVFSSSDGTQWTTRVPRAPTDAWRFGLVNHQDGPRNQAKVHKNENLSKVQLLSMMISDDVLKEVCKWTNNWAHHSFRKWNHEHPRTKPRLWRDTNPTELKGFLGLILLGGIEKHRKKPWSELWSKDEKIRNSAFVAAMSRNRFMNLINALRFDDAIKRYEDNHQTQAGSQHPVNKFRPIRKVFEEITSAFQHLFTPASKVGLGKKVVLDLVSKYKGTSRGVIADNFFTSMDLVKELIEVKLTYCGTVRKQKIEIPPFIRGCSSAEKENTFVFNEDNLVTLVRHNPKKNRYVLLLSSAHYDNETILVQHKKGEFNLPVIIDYYNSNKGGVDTADQMVGNYTGQYPTKRWSMKIFIHCLDCVVLNSYIIWRRNDPSWNNAHKSSRRKYIRELAYDLITPQIRLRAATVGNLHRYVRSAMKDMGIDYSPDDSRRIEVATTSTAPVVRQQIKQGRCRFDGGLKYCEQPHVSVVSSADTSGVSD